MVNRCTEALGNDRWAYLGNVQETSATSQEGTSREVQLRDTLQSTFIQYTSTVCNAFTSLEQLGKERVMLHPLFK